MFRSLKSELLRLRPIYHHKSTRVDGHLFISVLAYHLVDSLRIRLKAQGIHLSWESLRNQFAGQERVTVVLHRDDGQIYHIRKATRPEPHQQVLYNALGATPSAGQDREDAHRSSRRGFSNVVPNPAARKLQLIENTRQVGQG